MRTYTPWLSAVVLTVLGAGLAAGQTPGNPAKIRTPKDVEALTEFLEQLIPTKTLTGKKTLEQFLAALEKALPADKKFKVGLDKAALGKDYDHVAKQMVNLKQHGEGEEMTHRRILEAVLDQVVCDKELVEDLGPGYIQITTIEHLKVWDVVYDLKDVLARAHAWKHSVKTSRLDPGKNAPAGGADLVAHLVALNVDPEHWNPGTANGGSITAVNGNKLIVTTHYANHQLVMNVLDTLASLDVSVKLEAELFEVDQAFYAQRIVPLLKSESGPARAAVPVGKALADDLKKSKLVLKGDDTKIPDRQQGVVLALKKTISYLELSVMKPAEEPIKPVPAPKAKFNTFPIPEDMKVFSLPPLVAPKKSSAVFGLQMPPPPAKADEPENTYQAAAVGVSFEAHVQVTPDRQAVKLKLTQQAAELVGMKKLTPVDLDTGKPAKGESPAIRTTVLNAALEVFDGEPVLMPAAYQTPQAKAKGRVLVLLVTPMIWIEEEQKQLQKQLEEQKKAGQ